MGNAGRRIAAVERVARTREIISGRLGQEHAGRIGERGGQLGKGRGGRFAARAASRRAICSPLSGFSGSSEATKWLISKSAPTAPQRSRAARSSLIEAK